ncbi:MAG TPA: hypothetical protein VGK22_03495 [Candidatus Angelobacter sp.]
MIETLAEAIQQFESLSDESKTLVMARLSYDLTIHVRDLILESGASLTIVKKLEGINEVQHRALGQLIAYMTKRQKRYPDKDIFILLLKMAKDCDILGSIQNSLFAALETYR